MLDVGFDKILKIAIIAFAVIFSIVSVDACLIDKSRARKGTKRIPEARLILFASFGGALLMYITMLLIRHKTRHAVFMTGLPAMILFQAAAAYLILFA